MLNEGVQRLWELVGTWQTNTRLLSFKITKWDYVDHWESVGFITTHTHKADCVGSTLWSQWHSSITELEGLPKVTWPPLQAETPLASIPVRKLPRLPVKGQHWGGRWQKPTQTSHWGPEDLETGLCPSVLKVLRVLHLPFFAKVSPNSYKHLSHTK